MRLRGLLLLAAGILLTTRPGTAQQSVTPHVEAELLSAVESIQGGKPFHLALRLRMENGWHTYWQNPGDAGMATGIAWKLPEGFTAGPILWPMPARIGEPPEVSYGYDGEVLLLTEITPPRDLPPGRITIEAAANWLVCKEACIPGKKTLSLSLPATRGEGAPNRRWSDAFARTLRNLPVEQGEQKGSAWLRGDTILLRLPIPPGAKPVTAEDLYFFPSDEGVIDHSVPQHITLTGTMVDLVLLRSQYADAPPTAIRGVLASSKEWIDGHPGITIALQVEPGQKAGGASAQ